MDNILSKDLPAPSGGEQTNGSASIKPEAGETPESLRRRVRDRMIRIIDRNTALLRADDSETSAEPVTAEQVVKARSSSDVQKARITDVGLNTAAEQMKLPQKLRALQLRARQWRENMKFPPVLQAAGDVLSGLRPMQLQRQPIPIRPR